MTTRQDRIANGCGLVTKEIALHDRWNTKLAKNILTRLIGLMTDEVKNLEVIDDTPNANVMEKLITSSQE